jgi:FKBP-type peptidyl-prolyl cis-trans isomerase
MKTILVIMLTMGIVLLLAGCGEKKSDETKTPSTPPVEEKASEPEAPAPKAEAPAEKTKDGFIVTKSGLKYKDIKVGTGPEVKAGDVVVVNYKGWLDNGTVFDSSKKPGGQPISVPVGRGQVIKGWDEGLQGMKKGGVRELTIPPDLGYGSDDMGTIPPNSTLHFEVDLLKISS